MISRGGHGVVYLDNQPVGYVENVTFEHADSYARADVPAREWKDFKITRSGTFRVDAVSWEWQRAVSGIPISYKRDVPIPVASPAWVILPEWE